MMVNQAEFITKFKEQFLEVEKVDFNLETDFRKSGDYDSLTGMAVLVMIEDEYKVVMTPDELKACGTISDILNLVNAKK